MHEEPKKAYTAKPTDYIELDRRFKELGENTIPEQTALDSYTRALLGNNHSLSWGDVLKKRLVVILGEPGSGKTYEFRQKCEEIKENGKYAFFVRLDALVDSGLRDVLAPPVYIEFEKWQKDSVHATFFLDSVDEAKFHKTSDFYQALDRFCNSFGSECLRRASILISSRISEWQPHVDRSEVLSRFRALRQPVSDDHRSINREAPILVVQIEALDSERVNRYVTVRDVPNPTAFVEALNNEHLWEFARRPIDVVDLIDYWQNHNKFSSLTEMIEHSIASKLRWSQRDRDDPLSEQDARDGASILGAAAVLCKTLNFKVPDETFACSNAIDANQCLSEDWSLNKRQALLNRPIFDSASYGRIRFHTRRVAEYLASTWLKQRMNDGCPITELQTILFNCQESQRIVRKALAPATAWLCCGDQGWNEDVYLWSTGANCSRPWSENRRGAHGFSLTPQQKPSAGWQIQTLVMTSARLFLMAA